MRLLLLLSLLSFAMAHRSMAHAETIVIRDSDFGVGGGYTGAMTTNVTGAPMQIVPARIGQPEPASAHSAGDAPAGLLVPRTTDVLAVAPTVAVSGTTPVISAQ
jgi:hypothetical protein